MLKALIARFGKGQEKEMERLANEELKETLEKCSTPSAHSFDFLLSPTHWLQNIHFSWAEPTLSSLPKQTAAFCLPLFPHQAQAPLQKTLDVPLPPKTSPFQRLFFAHFLKTKMVPPTLLPKEHLPPSAVNPLLDLSKDKLMQLIDLLGIYDLAADLKRVIDRSLLDKIHKSLNTSQMQFLHHAASSGQKWTPPPLYLERWDGDKKKLFLLLHKRGLTRLGRALFLEDKDFKWHLTHKLDTGRGAFLMKLFAGKEDPDMISFFKGQLLHLMKRERT